MEESTKPDLGLWRALWHFVLNTMSWFLVQVVRISTTTGWILFSGIGGFIIFLDMVRMLSNRKQKADGKGWGWLHPKAFQFILRVGKAFEDSGIIRKKEHESLSAGAMNIAGMGLVWMCFSDQPWIVANVLLWLGLGDPAARIFSLHFGAKPNKWLLQKSVIGCTYFLGFGTLGTLLTWICHVLGATIYPGVEVFGFTLMQMSPGILFLALAAGLTIAMLVEVYSEAFESPKNFIHGWDNLLIPFVSALVLGLFV